MVDENKQQAKDLGIGIDCAGDAAFFPGLLQLPGAFSPMVTPFSPENGRLYFRNGDFQ